MLRSTLKWHALEVKELALVGQPVGRQAGQDDGQRLPEHRPGSRGIATEGAELVGRHAAAHPEVEAAAAQVIEHANLLDQSQRVIERKQIDEGTQANAPGAL